MVQNGQKKPDHPGRSRRSPASGFKKSVKSGIVVNASDRQSTGVTVLEVGDISNTVEVTADAAQLQIKTESGEQSTAIKDRKSTRLNSSH